MNGEERKKMELIAEITVQRFFTHYLEEVWPEQLAASITAHNKDVTAHNRQIKDAIKAESSRIRVWLMGLILTGGVGSGIGIAKFFFGS